MKQTKSAGHLAALFTILVWGTTFISTKVLLVDFQPVEILFFRFVLGLVALLAAFLWACYSILTKKIAGFGFRTILTTRRARAARPTRNSPARWPRPRKRTCAIWASPSAAPKRKSTR